MGEKQASETNFGPGVGKGLLGKLVQAVFGFAGVIIFTRLMAPTVFAGFYLLLSLVKIVKRPISGVSQTAIQQYAKTDSARRELLGAQFLIVGSGWQLSWLRMQPLGLG